MLSDFAATVLSGTLQIEFGATPFPLPPDPFRTDCQPRLGDSGHLGEVTQQVLSSGQWANTLMPPGSFLITHNATVTSHHSACLSSLLSRLSSRSRMAEDLWQIAYDCAIKVARKAGEVAEGALLAPSIRSKYFFFFPALGSNRTAPAGHQGGRRARNQDLDQELHRGPGDKDRREGGENHHGGAEGGVW